MTHHSLRFLAVPIALRLQRVQDASHLLRLLLRQYHFSRSEILLQALRLRCSWNRDHALRNHPRQGDLRQRATLTLRERLDLLDNFLVGVEVLALEFGDCLIVEGFVSACFVIKCVGLTLTRAAKIVWSEIFRGLVREVVDEPAVA